MPYERGRQSRQTSTFMLAADVRAFDEMLAPNIDGLACWSTDSRRSDRSVTIHESLGDALTGEAQAFLRLTEEKVPTGPQVQYLPTEVVGGSWTGPRVDPETPDAFICAGRLAFLWFPDEAPDPIRTRFADLVKVVWRALHAVTAAHPRSTPEVVQASMSMDM
ncbi:hypothetical protein KOI35_25080 [Actinoplanes bogorensis]|uniref:Uncharacterized protein n=1 Tax=Paractinoplanes bogorensis TaxID=1610840 RepID=A0ABS5YTV0_9ACTN|nr:hypothetical protein [Actinoplanes bogorensis]MBU2666788.1 hypothetical protein [Actinoplanes bogorensis]